MVASKSKVLFMAETMHRFPCPVNCPSAGFIRLIVDFTGMVLDFSCMIFEMTCM
jgi:hypothetical protein